MSLEKYSAKRDFRKTPEPRAKKRRAPVAAGRSFVVQKHAATRLHYDLRLEHDGVLKSWAVPKGPSLDPSAKRLAVQVEDHPLDYGGFEGVIPKGQYGGGSVLLWDRGTWEPKGDAEAGLQRGKLEFTLSGEKLRGRWLLVRTGGGARAASGSGDADGRAQWLLRKLADDEARPETAGAITEERPESVDTGRTLEEIGRLPKRVWRSHRSAAHELDPGKLPKAKRATLPRFVEPQLATLVAKPPEGDDRWLHELKLDGYRVLCRLERGEATLLTRRGHDWTDRFGRISSAVAFVPAETAMLDGEVVWLGEDGRTDFQALQQALGEGRDERLVYFAFDLLHLDGFDLSRAPLRDRKEALAALLAAAPQDSGTVRLSDHVAGRGAVFLAEACRIGLEGIVAKRADAPYRSGRGTDWLKVKCKGEQELVIVGWSEPSGSRSGLGALLLGVRDRRGGALRYAGKVGTGFDAATLGDLRRRLAPLERAAPPVTDPPRGYRARGVHWVEPELVAQVEFTGWTDDGVLRHPSYKGLREDKEAAEVVREQARAEGNEEAAADRPTRATAGAAKARATKSKGAGGKAKSTGTEVAGVRLSNPDRVLYPELGLTKLELARYYERAADWMLPHLMGRPLALLRCPAGRDKHCFYQKHLAEATPPTLVEVPVTERGGERATYVAAESLAGLVSLVQLGVLEVHPWGSRRQHLDRPDVLVFDLDPGPGVDWPGVVAAARELRDLLAELSLTSFAKLSGGKGLHLVVPIEPRLQWEPAKAFCKAVVDLLAERAPGRYTTVMTKSKRRGRIFLDYLRNGFGNTAVAPYSSRARPGAPVAAPVRWEELGARTPPDRYTVRNLGRRLASLRADPWEGFFELGQSVPKAVLRQLEVT